MEKSYINLFTLEQLNKYGLTKDDQNKIAVLVNKAINEELYTSTKDFQHNLLHIERVIAYICMIANKLNSEDIDLELLLTAALYHDIGKTLGASNKMHGFVGAKQFLDNHVGDLDYKKATIISTLIKQHALEEDKIDFFNVKITDMEKIKVQKMSDILKDADALDRNRFNYPAPVGGCDINKLRTKEAKTVLSVSNAFLADYNLAMIHNKEELEGKTILNNYKLLDEWISAFHNGEKNIFHASLNPCIEKLEVNESTQKGKYVYGGIDPVDCFKMATFRSSTLFPREKNAIKEIFPGTIDETLDSKYISIYKLPKEKFVEYLEPSTKAPNGEWISYDSVVPTEQVSFEALDLLHYLELKNEIKIIKDYTFSTQFLSFINAFRMYIWQIKQIKDKPFAMDKHFELLSTVAQYYSSDKSFIDILGFVRNDIDNEIRHYIDSFTKQYGREPDYDNENECLKNLLEIYNEKYFYIDDDGQKSLNEEYLNKLLASNNYEYRILNGNLDSYKKNQDLIRKRAINGYFNCFIVVIVTLMIGVVLSIVLVNK